jgi:signal transduction histidine kinase/CheY-like chemotaxis protein
MLIRVKIMMTMILITIPIIIIGISAGVLSTGRSLTATIEDDLRVSVNIANQLISSEIDMLEVKALQIAQLILISESDPAEILPKQLNEYAQFLSLTILDRAGVIASSGISPAPAEFRESSYAQRAFAGERIFSSTERNPGNGDLVLYLCVPLGNRILVATIPGLYFSSYLSSITIWKTGHFFLIDADGYVLANIRHNWVLDRHNFIQQAVGNPRLQSIASVISNMTRGESGVGSYDIDGVERICVYCPVTRSRTGWALGLVAPLNESPLSSMRNGLLVIGIVCLALGSVAIFFTSKYLSLPYTQLEELKDIAESQSHAKSDFLAHISHEMRTPLNVILGLSELTIRSGEAEGKNLENIKKVHTSGVTLLKIVNDILDITKIESGKFECMSEEYDLPSLINDTANLNIIRLGSKPITFHLHVEGTLPAKLVGDGLRIKQIFNNLLSNAFKYTLAGRVDWTVSCAKDGDNVLLYSSITDTGIGIRKEDLEKLFSNFSRVGANKRHAIAGTGLGLSITRKITEMMGGSITVESEYGKGSTFTVCLPQAAVDDKTIGPKCAESLCAFRYTEHKRDMGDNLVRAHLPHVRILLVDDIPLNLDVAMGVLEPYGMQMDCAASGQEAVDMIRKGEPRYDAIFMDHMMPPGIDGIEATRIIREEIDNEYARTVPIIALTANALIGNEELFLSKGFQAFLSKPIDIMQMDGVINRWVIRDRAAEYCS